MRITTTISFLFLVLLPLMCVGCAGSELGAGLADADVGTEKSCTSISSTINIKLDEFLKSLDSSCTTSADCASAHLRIARRETLCMAGCPVVIAKRDVETLSRHLETNDELTLLCEDFASNGCLPQVSSCLGGEPLCVAGVCQLVDRSSNHLVPPSPESGRPPDDHLFAWIPTQSLLH